MTVCWSSKFKLQTYSCNLPYLLGKQNVLYWMYIVYSISISYGSFIIIFLLNHLLRFLFSLRWKSEIFWIRVNDFLHWCRTYRMSFFMDREWVLLNDNWPSTTGYWKTLNSVRKFIGPSIVICVTVAVEEFASFILFECPCDASHRLYGMAYLLGPAILLLLLGLVWQNNLWRLVTGSFRRSCCSLRCGFKLIEIGFWLVDALTKVSAI